MKFPTIKEMAEEVAEKALDEFEYKDKTLRQWIEIISATDINVATKDGTNLAEVGTDLISRQALLDKFEPWLKVKDYNDGELNMLKAILYEIRFMRSAQPEIIRCKDCKHFAGEGMYCSCDIIVQFDHFYCYHAERRQDV